MVTLSKCELPPWTSLMAVSAHFLLVSVTPYCHLTPLVSLRLKMSELKTNAGISVFLLYGIISNLSGIEL